MGDGRVGRPGVDERDVVEAHRLTHDKSSHRQERAGRSVVRRKMVLMKLWAEGIAQRAVGESLCKGRPPLPR